MGGIATGLVYGLLVFAAGFLFGALREGVLIPALGTRAGHLLEFPLIVAATVAIAFIVARRHARSLGTLVAVGIVGAVVIVVIESGFALLVLGRPLEAYLAQYDITAGALFPYGLAVVALAPALSRLATRR